MKRLGSSAALEWPSSAVVPRAAKSGRLCLGPCFSRNQGEKVSGGQGPLYTLCSKHVSRTLSKSSFYRAALVC